MSGRDRFKRNEIYAPSKEKNGTILNLFLGFCIYQLSLHLFFLISSKDPRVLMPTIISSVHDLLLFSLYYILAVSICRQLSAKIKIIAEKIFSIGFIVLGSLFSLYPGLLREILIYPVNIFESDAGTTKTLIFDYLGFYPFIPLFIALALGTALFFTKKSFDVPPKIKTAGFAIILLLSILFLRSYSPQPVVYSVQAEIENIINNEERAVPSLAMSEKENYGKIAVLRYPENRVREYDHVLMIVFETTTSKDFEKEFMGINNGFFQQNKEHIAYYGNYYATNLDSYTSLIAMMTGIQVPYRSYSDVEIFDKVNRAPNLADFFNKNGFESSFVSTFEYQPFIPSKAFWNNTFIRKDFDNIESFISIGSSRMEMATEDKAAIAKIVGEMKKNNKTFILHEMAYGHNPEWRAKIGKTTLEYYNEYLNELSEELKKESLFDKTLFIIVADHGDRTDSADANNYHVPLLFVGKNIKNNTDTRFLSHTDLPYIIYYYLSAGTHPAESDKIFAVGSTEKWVYGVITKNKDYLFIDNARGVVLSQSGNMDAPAVNSDFQRYVTEFNYLYGKNLSAKH